MSGNLNMNGKDISGVNKLYVTTIDPVYQIGGVKYATYVSNTIGQKERRCMAKPNYKHQAPNPK